MFADLMKFGFVEVTDRSKVELLREVYTELRHKGHALHFAEEIRAGEVVKLSVYHYRSCVVCQPDRSIP
jgi:hypothetical protein